MATHSSILAWEIPWTEEPGGLQYMGSQVGPSLTTKPPTTRCSMNQMHNLVLGAELNLYKLLLKLYRQNYTYCEKHIYCNVFGMIWSRNIKTSRASQYL